MGMFRPNSSGLQPGAGRFSLTALDPTFARDSIEIQRTPSNLVRIVQFRDRSPVLLPRFLNYPVHWAGGMIPRDPATLNHLGGPPSLHETQMLPLSSRRADRWHSSRLGLRPTWATLRGFFDPRHRTLPNRTDLGRYLRRRRESPLGPVHRNLNKNRIEVL
jgi:hypothetical protein